MSTQNSATDPLTYEDGYEVVSLRINWSSLSMLFFVLTMLAPYLADFIAFSVIGHLPPHLVWVPLVTLFALLGSLCGFVGYRFSANQSLAKIGLALNGIVFSLMLLFFLLMMVILRLR